MGVKLRRARIERSLSIEETAWRTRIRPDTLRALELDRFDEVGHPAFVKTHLSSYARFLGMDPAEVVDDFDALHDELPSSIEELERVVQESHKPPRAKWPIAAAISGVVLALGALAGVLGGQEERAGSAMPPPAPLAPQYQHVIRVTIAVQAVDTTTVSAIVDGKQLYEGPLAPGETKTFRAERTVELMAADAASVRLTVNGKDAGVAGDQGSAYRARFGPNGRIPS